MDTNKLKRFAIEARNTLKRGVAAKLQSLGFDASGHFDESEMPIMIQGGAIFRGQQQSEAFYHQWMSLYNRIKEKGVKEVYEEAAYTWFNRFIAIRILQKNGLAEPVLDFVDVARTPHIVDAARMGHLPQMSVQDESRLRELLSDVTAVTEQFALLVTAYCHQTPILYKCFGSVADYTELLLPNDILAEDGFLDQLNHTPFITDEDYHSTELLGWLYQFYISERKDEVFAKKGKFEADEIAAATQIFTPNWIVKYMVQNTIGRIYLDNNPGAASTFKSKWNYLVEPSENTPKEAIYKYDELTDLKVGDLACGSGHILIESFDLMYDLYIHEGYTRKEAIENIFKCNLTGIDLDTRAKQLAQFALLLKACQKDNSFADAHVMPHVLDMPKPIANEKVADYLQTFFRDVPTRQQLEDLSAAFELMQNADSLGSIMKFEMAESTAFSIIKTLAYWHSQKIVPKEVSEVLPSFELIIALSTKYSALVMNPPYMGSGSMNNILSNYARTNYEEGKADLFSIFMILAINRLADNGKYGMINMHSWMFLSSFNNLRKSIIDNYFIESLLHLGPRTFDELSGEVVQNATFVISKTSEINKKWNESCRYTGTYFRLVEGRNCSDKERLFFNAKAITGIYFPKVDQQCFKKIPSCPIGYWLSDNIIRAFDFPNFSEIGEPRSGIMTGNSPLYVKLFFEVSKHKIGFRLKSSKEIISSKKKWFPIVAGGSARKWYGNLDSVVNMENDGADIKANVKNFRLREPKYYFRESITWPKICSGTPTFRLCPQGVLFGDSGLNMFVNDKLNIYLGLLNSKVATHILRVINPTFNNQVSDIGNIPISSSIPEESDLITTNITISKNDWDAHENSWDFLTNELVAVNDDNFLDIINDYADFHEICIDPAAPEPESLEWRMSMYEMKWETNFYRLKKNEEELNRLFIEIYGLQDELEEFVPTSEITILQQGEISIIPAPGDDSGYGDTFIWNRDVIIKQLISYAVGCWMGRYRLDKPGLHIAHPNPTDEEVCTYKYGDSQLTIDDDGIIPILPAECGFDDNLMKRVQEFIRIAFGREQVNQNISFVEACLGTTIEKYLIKDFWKDHKKMYQNRPIYWLFSSKKGAFQCLVYMHRMNANTADRVRCNYLMPHMDWLRQQIAGYTANAVALNTAERNRLKKLRSDLEECEEYNDRLQLVADHRIAFDLDDGVVVNYAKFGDVLAKIK